VGRRPNYASSIYRGKDGKWHGRVTVGVKDDGRPDRRHVEAKTQAEVTRKVRSLERERDAGKVRKAGQRWTVKAWLTHWIENIAVPPHIGDNTHAGYLGDVETHLIPGIGAHRLDRLEPEHLERLYAKMQRNGSAAGNAHHVHRTIRTALNEAVRRGHLAINPASVARAPRLPETEVEPYDVGEVKRLLKVAAELPRNSARWAVALALGLRQGEALGLRWEDVDLANGVLWVRQSRLRPKYVHGCGGKCGQRAGSCPARRPARPVTKATKSRAGRRRIGLPDQLVVLLQRHRDEQAAERALARNLWSEGGWVFTSPVGAPVNPSTDYHQWKALLKKAGVRDGRLHDARHSAATVLLVLGVPERTVMSIMGWSTTAMAARYQHVTDPIRRAVAERLDGILWGTEDGDYREPHSPEER
jgi:integrase